MLTTSNPRLTASNNAHWMAPNSYPLLSLVTLKIYSSTFGAMPRPPIPFIALATAEATFVPWPRLSSK